MEIPVITLKPGIDQDNINQYLDLETALKVAGPGSHYSVLYTGLDADIEITQIFVDGEFAGTISETPDQRSFLSVWIGFWVRPEFRGKGVVRQALIQYLEGIQSKVAFINLGCWENNTEAMKFIARFTPISSIGYIFAPREYPEQYGEVARTRTVGLKKMLEELRQTN